VVEDANERRGLGCALRSTRTGGHCTVTSLHSAGKAQIPIFEMYLRTITLAAGRANSRITLPPVLELIADGSIDPALVTSETASWDQAPEALLGYTTKLIVDCARDQ
jgi:alcohol dehydrogenase